MGNILAAVPEPKALPRPPRPRSAAVAGSAALGLAIVLSGCAAVTPAPRFSSVSPADAEGPEAGTPPAAPALADEPEALASPPPEEPPPAMPGHEGHSGRGGAPAQDGYTCPTHPEVRETSPGACPRCGAPLVPRTAEERRP